MTLNLSYLLGSCPNWFAVYGTYVLVCECHSTRPRIRLSLAPMYNITSSCVRSRRRGALH